MNEMTIRLEPEKARKVDTALGLIAKTAHSEIQWARRGEIAGSPGPITAYGFSPRRYEARDGEGKWWLTIKQPYFTRTAEVELTRVDEQGASQYSVTGVAALDGLAAIVEKTVLDQEDQALKRPA